MEDLDNLSDDQLRIRILQYGLPNLPVTDTTRKVLLKKLKVVMGNETAKTRRETVAVSKFSSDEEPEKDDAKARGAKASSRRATVAVTEKSSVKKLNGPTGNGRAETPTKTPSRRTSRATPAKQEPIAVAAAVLQEDSDEDIIEIPVKRRSSSRTTTPTLGKSDTVRTSYKTSVDVVEENQGEDSSNLDESVEEILPPPKRKPSPVFTQSASRRKTFTTSTSSFSANLPEKSTTPTKFGIPAVTTSYTRRGTYNFNEPTDEEDPIELDESNTPYLSNFAKRLSTLRAEPLDTGMDKYKSIGASTSSYKSSFTQPEYTSSYAKPSYSYKSQVAPAPKPARKSGVLKDLGQIYDSLDRQYNFRNILYIIVIVMIIVAIYVLFM